MDGFIDIIVSFVYISDFLFFEEDIEEEVVMFDSMEEGEIMLDDEDKNK